MTDKELILNFISQYDRPFNAEVIAQLTSVSRDVIERILPELIQDRAIKQIEVVLQSTSEPTASKPGSVISTTGAGLSA